MKTSQYPQMDRLFNPRGVAIFGGVNTFGAFGHMYFTSLVQYGYQGRLYPVSKKGGEVVGTGHKIYTSLSEIDGPVDLASISVPAEAVPGLLRECLEHGVAGAQVQSSGFSELGSERGDALQAELREIAEAGLLIVGPNCFGLHSPRGGITLLPGSDFSREPGPVAFISQSGGAATDFGYEAAHKGLGLSKMVSFGNGASIGATDFLEYMAQDADTGLVAAYLEGVRDGRRFLEVLKKTTREKPVVVWKAGLTDLGRRAALSHTASLAGEAGVWQGALAQAGAVGVQGLDEMMDVLMALHYLKSPGRRVALLGGGGAIGVFSSDLASRWGLEVPTFSPETQKMLQEFFPTPGNSVANPLDTGSPVLPIETIQSLVRIVLEREPVDALIVIMLIRPLEIQVNAMMELAGMPPDPPGKYLAGLVEPLAEIKRETGKDIIMVLENRSYRIEEMAAETGERQSRALFQKAGLPVFATTERALRGIKHSLTVRG